MRPRGGPEKIELPRIAALVIFVLAGFGLAPAVALAGPAVTPLVSTAWLADNLSSDGLVMLDIRAASDFAAGHIPGAEQTDYPGAWRTTQGDIPWVLPDIADLEALLSGLGIGNDTTVVIVPAGTDATELGGATWIYWVLKYLGHDGVAILDGGFSSWTDEGRPTDTGAGTPPVAADFTANPRPELIASTDYVAARLYDDVVLVDARSPIQYAGTTQSTLVTRPGHIPGAVNLDNATLFDAAAHRLKSVGRVDGRTAAAAFRPNWRRHHLLQHRPLGLDRLVRAARTARLRKRPPLRRLDGGLVAQCQPATDRRPRSLISRLRPPLRHAARELGPARTTDSS